MSRSTRIAVYLVMIHFYSIANADETRLVQTTSTKCSNIMGDFSFWGTVNINDHEVPVSFLQRLNRPSRVGIRWVRIMPLPQNGEFKISFLDDEERVIGNDILLDARCVSGKWQETDSFRGNSDGTFVQGTRSWNYYLNDQSALVVDYSGISESRYLPGLSSNNHSENRAFFSKR